MKSIEKKLNLMSGGHAMTRARKQIAYVRGSLHGPMTSEFIFSIDFVYPIISDVWIRQN